jgi:hypothetical protein
MSSIRATLPPTPPPSPGPWQRPLPPRPTLQRENAVVLDDVPNHIPGGLLGLCRYLRQWLAARAAIRDGDA